MKLAEIKTGQAVDALLKIAMHIKAITSDEELMDTIGQAIDIQGKNLNARGVKGEYIRQWSNFVCVLLEKRREDIFGIVAAVNCVDVAQIEEQTLMETLRQIEEIRDDPDLIRFFSVAAKREQTA